MATTKIEWAEKVWNPVTGCTPVSEGCGRCYAQRMANRLRGRCGYPADEPFRVAFHRDRLDEPQRWKKPHRIFVCPMGDLWHPDVLPEDRAAVIRATNLAPQHTYLFLTKRPERLDIDWSGSPNLSIGTSVENQAAADERIPWLLKCPGAVRFLSCEPLLGPVNFQQWLGTVHNDQFGGTQDEGYGPWVDGISWVVAGGETGPGARPMHPDWARSLRDQCQSAGVPFFFKHHGEWKWDGGFVSFEQWVAKAASWIGRRRRGSVYCMDQAGRHCTIGRDFMRARDERVFPVEYFARVGKKAAGRLLDGREWNELPAEEPRT